MDQQWISTGEAIRMLGFSLSPRTFRDKYEKLMPWFKTDGGHFRWLKSAVSKEVIRQMELSHQVDKAS